MPETRLVAKLKATTAITDIVGSKIFPIMAPVKKKGKPVVTIPPYITYQTISDQSENHSTGATETNHCRMQIDLWASTYADAKTLATAVKTALKNWTDNTGSPVISSCHYENGNDLPDPPLPGQEVQVHRVSQDYFLWYTP
jgi:hypothetical protein